MCVLGENPNDFMAYDELMNDPDYIAYNKRKMDELDEYLEWYLKTKEDKEKRIKQSLDDILAPYENRVEYNNDNKYDISTEPKFINGQLQEAIVADVLTNPNIKFEVKSEFKTMWGRTGNVYVEYEQRKKDGFVDSGISSTEADYWTFVLKGYDETDPIEFIVMVKTDQLKKRIELLKDKGFVVVGNHPKSDDGTETNGWLLPLNQLLLYDGEYADYSKKRLEKLSYSKKPV